MYGRTRCIHFVGIGGSGMSGIAEVLLNMGYEVSGSDLKSSEATERLARLGCRVSIGHSPAHLQGAPEGLVSTAVKPDNPELIAANGLGVPVIPRAEMLAELMRMKYGIAVGGSHGKTTTTSMIAAVLGRGALDPTIVVGGRLHAIGSNARLGTGPFLVAEADESDGSFLRLAPAVTVITNIDREHLDHFETLEALHQAFVYFANRVPFYGVCVLGVDDPGVRAVLPHVTKRHLLFGTSPEAEIRAGDVELRPHGSRFRAVAFGQEVAEVELRIPGRHNVLNALAAVAVGLEVGVPPKQIAEGLAEFRGVSRRFELRGESGGVRLLDDYGHHPTEILATLAAARGLGGRVLVIFQPHRYSRTATLAREFGAAFRDADRVWVLDIYAAGEPPIAGISARTVVESARAQGFQHLEHAPDPALAVAAVAAEAQVGDTVLTLGAGDVWKLGNQVLELLGARAGAVEGRG